MKVQEMDRGVYKIKNMDLCQPRVFLRSMYLMALVRYTIQYSKLGLQVL